MLLPTPTLLLAAALTAPTLILHVESLQIKPSPPRHPPKSLSSRSSSGPTTTPRTTWNRGGRSSSWQHSSTKPLRAYTVADNRNINPWLSFLKFPTSFADLASQFGAEGTVMCDIVWMMGTLTFCARLFSFECPIFTVSNSCLFFEHKIRYFLLRGEADWRQLPSGHTCQIWKWKRQLSWQQKREMWT